MHVRHDSSKSRSSSLLWLSSCSWLRLSRRRGSSAHPTIETADPHDQKISLWLCLWRPPHCRATAIAALPWRESTTSATASVPGLPDFHHTKSEGQALRVSLVKPGAYLSASYGRDTVRGIPIGSW